RAALTKSGPGTRRPVTRTPSTTRIRSRTIPHTDKRPGATRHDPSARRCASRSDLPRDLESLQQLIGIVIVVVDEQPFLSVTVTVMPPEEPAAPPTLNLMDRVPAPDVMVPLEIDQE